MKYTYQHAQAFVDNQPGPYSARTGVPVDISTMEMEQTGSAGSEYCTVTDMTLSTRPTEVWHNPAVVRIFYLSEMKFKVFRYT